MSPQPLQPPQQLPVSSKTAWFVLGREPLVSAAEIFNYLHIETTAARAFFPPILKIVSRAEPQKLIHSLGGTIKIATELAEGVSEDLLVQLLQNEARSLSGKINFGISIFGFPDEQKAFAFDKVGAWGKKVKNSLKAEGRSVRYVPNKELVLSSATVFHNHLVTEGKEFLVLFNEKYGTFDLAITQAVQPFEEFSARDFGRPGRDDLSGMLPPKLALMMLNIAGASTSGTLLDPFCGSGTILTEAFRLGYTKLVGSDISEKAVADTKKNIAWTREMFPGAPGEAGIHIFQSDVAAIDRVIPTASVDAVIAEPYMGPPLKGREDAEHVKKACAALAELYLSAFASFTMVLKPGGSVVFIIPRFMVNGSWLTISDRIIPELKKLGFQKTRLVPEEMSKSNYLLYHRPGQRVGREIWKFMYTPQ